MARSQPVGGRSRILRSRRWLRIALGVVGVGVSVALAIGSLHQEDSPEIALAPRGELGQMVSLPGGSFRMGNDLAAYPDQRPAHDVRLHGFWIDSHEVTNRQFADFVDQSDYITTAEQQGWALVFDRTSGDWIEAPGADWRHPGGAHTGIDGREDWPVVQVSWYDADAYARWVGCRLPTEAEWEYAARAGLRDADFPWGRAETVDGRYGANYWQGWFPDEDLAVDGFDDLAPVRSFPANGFGLYDMSGNVWEWCADWYEADYYRSSVAESPAGPADGPMRVQRGGSWLSAENYSPGYKVSVRSKRRPNVCYQDVGFRCVRRGAGTRL